MSTQSNAKQIEISDKEDKEEHEDDIEDNNTEEDIEDDNAEEKKEEEKKTMSFKFKTTWKAICGKEQLPGIQSVYLIKGALFIVNIEL
jgi:hypothetical protein